MNLHSNARTCPNSRAVIVAHAAASAWSDDQAETMGVSVRTGYKWVQRHREEGASGLLDRSSRPHRMPRQTASDRAALVVQLRKSRLTAQEIACRLKMPRSTVAAILVREGLSRLANLETPEPARRYEREAPGDLIHLDIKKLGRIGRPGHRVTGDRSVRTPGAGWEFVHVAVDDYSRLAYVEVLANEQSNTTVAFLRRALAFFRGHGIRVKRVLTDNGSPYRSHLFGSLCELRTIAHKFTRPYRPCTNGKAERFIQTALREWAYAQAYPTSDRRADELPIWLHQYNWHRPHGGIKSQTPISRLGLTEDNLLRLHI